MGNSLPVDSLSGDGSAVAEPDALAVLRLELDVTDLESVNALRAVPEGRARHELARRALRIGVLALEQARGRIDAEALRNEGERLMGALDASLADYRRQTETLLAGTLGSYFDQTSGRFNERVDRLVRQDGELERVMRTQIERHQREVGDVLAKFVGEESALHRLLAPDDTNRFLGDARASARSAGSWASSTSTSAHCGRTAASRPPRSDARGRVRRSLAAPGSPRTRRAASPA